MVLALIFSLRRFPTTEVITTCGNTWCMAVVTYKKTVAKQLSPPEPPKRPLSPYLRFYQHHKTEIHKKYPDMPKQEVAIKVKHIWRQLTFDEKNRWSLQYDREKVAHNISYKNYMKTLSLDQIQMMKNLKKKHELRKKIVITNEKQGINIEKPKVPGNAFTVYLKTLDRGETKLKEFMRTAACKWNLLTEVEKQPFCEEAKTLEKKYQNELSFWEMKALKAGREDLVQRHQELVKLKSAAVQSNNRITEEQIREIIPDCKDRSTAQDIR